MSKTTKAAFLEFASNCVVWEANAKIKEGIAQQKGDDLTARYEEGQAGAFTVAGMMARMKAESNV